MVTMYVNWPFCWTLSNSHWITTRVLGVLVTENYLIEAEWRIYASVNYPSLGQIMACRLAGAKPLSEPMLEYC